MRVLRFFKWKYVVKGLAKLYSVTEIVWHDEYVSVVPYAILQISYFTYICAKSA